MASKGMWEIDPETRSKLSQIQKKEGAGNDKCCDCGAPSPQWASPKFSTFICLTCAGTHRGLGVHVSFVRSISMDAFKQNEILRMQYGGNKEWQDFFSKNSGGAFQEATIKERYDCEVGEEWKEVLSAKVEERTFDKATWSRERALLLQKQANRMVPSAIGARNAGTGSGVSSRTHSPAPSKQGVPQTQKSQNETYFAKMGEANLLRSDHLPPSQGGKYGGFGSGMPEAQQSEGALPSADDFQKDPVAALTKGLGWFGNAMTRQAKVVNESYIQPTAKNLATSDFAAQARQAAIQAGQGIQYGAKGAAESLHKFVDGQDGSRATARKTDVEPERKDFWDSFGAPASTDAPKPSSIGTSAMKRGGSNPKKEDGWGAEW